MTSAQNVLLGHIHGLRTQIAQQTEELDRLKSLVDQLDSEATLPQDSFDCSISRVTEESRVPRSTHFVLCLAGTFRSSKLIWIIWSVIFGLLMCTLHIWEIVTDVETAAHNLHSKDIPGSLIFCGWVVLECSAWLHWVGAIALQRLGPRVYIGGGAPEVAGILGMGFIVHGCGNVFQVMIPGLFHLPAISAPKLVIYFSECILMDLVHWAICILLHEELQYLHTLLSDALVLNTEDSHKRVSDAVKSASKRWEPMLTLHLLFGVSAFVLLAVGQFEASKDYHPNEMLYAGSTLIFVSTILLAQFFPIVQFNNYATEVRRQARDFQEWSRFLRHPVTFQVLGSNVDKTLFKGLVASCASALIGVVARWTVNSWL